MARYARLERQAHPRTRDYGRLIELNAAFIRMIDDELAMRGEANPSPAAQPQERAAIVEEMREAIRAALNMVEGDGTPPNWDWLRSLATKQEKGGAA